MFYRAKQLRGGGIKGRLWIGWRGQGGLKMNQGMLKENSIIYKLTCICMLFITLAGCEDYAVWNDPYPARDEKANILYLSFTEAPKRLDPATAYLNNEIQIISQIYEAPLQYHYLLRPYTIIPQTLIQMPEIHYFDINDKLLPATAKEEQIAYTLYNLRIKPGIYYQPHPAFAQDENGQYLYHHLSPEELADKSTLSDFPKQGTRELIAEDYIYQIKRLAAPYTFSPISTFMQEYIVDLTEYSAQLQQVFANAPAPYIDLRQYPFKGVEIIDRYTYQIKIYGKYPQFLNWLTTHFFAPMPWEADVFYHQRGLASHNITLNWYPIGTGPYMLTENNPNQHMILSRNPHYHGDTFPTEGMPEDEAEGLLTLAGQSLPFLDGVVFTLEKESIPQWSKFLQGYYDYLRLDMDSFEQAVQIDAQGLELSNNIKDKNFKLYSRSSAAVYYWGFNMLDPVVGGYTEKARKLRKAISLVVDMQEYANIFLNTLAEVGYGPLPPDIFGYEAGQKVSAKRKNMSMNERLTYAKKLLAEAGYPNGRHAKTGEPLVLSYDVVAKGSPDEKARFGWMRKQLNKLGIQVEVRATQLSRFQQKMRTGTLQLYFWTWLADYPDPENFLFLFYSPSAAAINGGSNRSNYQNAQYDALFKKMKNMEDTPERLAIIQQMLQILEKDTPWFAMVYPSTFTIDQNWVSPMKPSDMVRNNIKYQKIDPSLRDAKRLEWNPPLLWPFVSIIIFMLLLAVPVVINYYRQQFKRPTKE